MSPGASLRERGFAVLESLWDEGEVAFLRSELEALWRASGAPACWAGPEGEGVLGPDLERWVTGVVFKRYLTRRPAMARSLLKPAMVAAIADYLGEGFRIESSTAVISDHGRPVFRWHAHVGGIDEEAYRAAGNQDAGNTPRWVSSLLYLQPVNEAEGQVYVHPRRLGDPTDPPHDPSDLAWPDRVAIRCPAGSVVLMDQALFHSVAPRSAGGLRMFVGAWFAGPNAPPAEAWDDSLDRVDDPALQALADARPMRR